MASLQQFAKSGCFQILSIEIICLDAAIFERYENRILLAFTGSMTGASTSFALTDFVIPLSSSIEIQLIIAVYAALADAITTESMDITINIPNSSLVLAVNTMVSSGTYNIVPRSHESQNTNFCLAKLCVLIEVLKEHGVQVRAEFRNLEAVTTIDVYNKFASIFFDYYFT
ncbi:hypothetical protein AOL_s00088g3 [Orbilia oligospora ATCC 24927]|uniref:Uncharacterized protein n=2 Tax=Orbilia oligospora TaxID=2813651 RepID=G1XHP0_ARTOA|nr:hypothetical protein AOL_s00088g3 [Orbilia oligospora ATCC 24927]EGX47288.1 hypothetical protein AOL_s00088g3 [Orbilia oligospora ATCC 24927]KAF3270549.1 hypothetical protein TWF970_010752 [Orbilia oligospora]